MNTEMYILGLQLLIFSCLFGAFYMLQDISWATYINAMAERFQLGNTVYHWRSQKHRFRQQGVRNCPIPKAWDTSNRHHRTSADERRLLGRLMSPVSGLESCTFFMNRNDFLGVRSVAGEELQQKKTHKYSQLQTVKFNNNSCHPN